MKHFIVLCVILHCTVALANNSDKAWDYCKKVGGVPEVWYTYNDTVAFCNFHGNRASISFLYRYKKLHVGNMALVAIKECQSKMFCHLDNARSVLYVDSLTSSSDMQTLLTYKFTDGSEISSDVFIEKLNTANPQFLKIMDLK